MKDKKGLLERTNIHLEDEQAKLMKSSNEATAELLNVISTKSDYMAIISAVQKVFN